ncbi:Ig-like domain-containing protein [Thiovibrio frasassiensis]|uniref:Ig-like domain-containing protein n=1 Tax=Thiovibrio frasassiensis TaxID=2984131 RepID=A0A9X4MFM6_9BACT|nr:Ig-like domain-containing protein [Thiovibrio frasassiensis]MDG4475458.1 Ig-like domain-containing protein [Thiovibrio frasassiensis]
MAEEKSGLEIDDWLDDLAEETPGTPAQEESGEMDQSDIDSLLGGGAASSGPSPDSDDGGELDQSDIDALLGGGGGGAAPVSAAGGGDEGFSELDQSDIDSLLGGGEEAPVAAAPSADDDFDLDQSDIDSLFSGADEETDSAPSGMTEGLGAPSKDDLDHLFSELGDDESGPGETVTFAEVAQQGSGKAGATASGEDNFGLPDDGGFDDDEFDFGDLPDIPDETNTVGTAPQGGMGEEDIFATASPAAAVPDFLAEATMDNSRENPSASSTDNPFAPPPKGGKKKGLAIAVVCLILLGGGGYWYMTKNKKGVMPVPVPPPAQEMPAAPVVAPPVVPPNAPPVASESHWRMVKANENLAIELTGTDPNNDPLKFEIVSPPKFGRISGDLPKITYLPNKDFPGEDSFEFQVSDGQLTSAPAKVVVMGPEEIKPVAAEAAPAEEKPVVAANNVRLRTLSTAPLTINWKKIWAGANEAPFDAKVSVEILGGAPLRGSLQRLDRGRHRYLPDRYFGGKEEVRYRFKAAGVYSKARKLIITVKRNDKPPVLVLRPVADSYKVGENVVLDAGLTKDDSPGGVRYTWEQVAGAVVHLEKFRGEDSAVSFIVPSSFRTEQKTRIVIRVTATDPGGQRASKEVAITPVSKRQSPLWGIPQ